MTDLDQSGVRRHGATDAGSACVTFFFVLSGAILTWPAHSFDECPPEPAESPSCSAYRWSWHGFCTWSWCSRCHGAGAPPPRSDFSDE